MIRRRQCAAITLAALFLSPTAGGAHQAVVTQLRELSEHIARRPHDVSALLARSDLFAQAGELDRALLDVDTALLESPDSSTAHLQRAVVLFELRRLPSALLHVERCFELGDETVPAYWIRAHIHEAMLRYPEALRDYDAALELHSTVELVVERGRLLVRLGRHDEAVAGYVRGLQTNAGAVVLRRALIELEIERGEVINAIPQIDAVMAKAAVKTEWLLLRADAWERLGESRAASHDRLEALREAEALLRVRRSPSALASHARALLALDRAPRAVTELEEAARRAPTVHSIRELLETARRAADRWRP